MVVSWRGSRNHNPPVGQHSQDRAQIRAMARGGESRLLARLSLLCTVRQVFPVFLEAGISSWDCCCFQNRRKELGITSARCLLHRGSHHCPAERTDTRLRAGMLHMGSEGTTPAQIKVLPNTPIPAFSFNFPTAPGCAAGPALQMRFLVPSSAVKCATISASPRIEHLLLGHLMCIQTLRYKYIGLKLKYCCYCLSDCVKYINHTTILL